MRGVDVDGGGTWMRFVERSGTGSPCIYLHALGDAGSVHGAALFRLPALTERRAFLVDLIGFGSSDRPEHWSYTIEEHARSVAALLDARGLQACNVVGHSLGGSVGILLADTRPDLVSRLIIAEANLRSGPDEGSNATMSRSIAAQSEDDYLRFGHETLSRDMARRWPMVTRVLQRADPRAMYRSACSLVENRSPSMLDILIRLSIPRTYIFGERSLEEPDMRARADNLPTLGIEVRVVPGADHWMGLVERSAEPAAYAATIAAALTAAA